MVEFVIVILILLIASPRGSPRDKAEPKSPVFSTRSKWLIVMIPDKAPIPAQILAVFPMILALLRSSCRTSSPNEKPHRMPPPPFREYKLVPTKLFSIVISVNVGGPPLMATPPPPRASPSGMELFDIWQNSMTAFEFTNPIPPPTFLAVLFVTCRSFKYGLALLTDIPPARIT